MARATIVLLALAAVLGVATAQTTKGTRFEGFTYASNVIGYVNMTRDYCDIQAAVDAGDYSLVSDLYLYGKNSARGDGFRTYWLFASHVPTAPEASYMLITMGRNATWIDNAINDAIAANNGPLAMGLMHVATMKYFLHELDEAYSKIGSYRANMSLTNFINDDSGAPHNVDEAWALWAGGNATNCGTLSGWAASLGFDMGSTFIGKSNIHAAMTAAVNELLAAARAGDLESFAATRGMIYRYLTMLGLQGVTRSVYAAELAHACGRPEADKQAALDHITVHWSYLEAFLVGRGMSATTIGNLETQLTADMPDYHSVLPAVKRVVHSMGRSVAELGYPSFKRINGDWDCSASDLEH